MDERLERLIESYLNDFKLGRLNCAETVLITMCDYYELEMGICPMIATPFGGGLCGTQGICGALSGALMVIGLRHGREMGGDRKPSYDLGKALMHWAEQQCGSCQCAALTGIDFGNAEQMAAFRVPGGAHERVCEPLVGEVCRWLAAHL